MILHPGILALYTGSLITLLLFFFAASLGVRILRQWDITSSSEQQLVLERRTYLISTIIQYGLFFEILSAFLFIYTADDLHNLLVGAMCATGSLNANPYGFPALYARLATLFTAAAWIAVNYVDTRAEDYPLTRLKYGLLLFLFPVMLSADILQLLYFLNIDPDVITSCCGTLFSEGGTGLSSSLASLPVRTMRVVFFVLFTITALFGITAATSSSTAPRVFSSVLYSALSLIFLIVSVAAIISFISLYFYQIPTHHCPFDILQSGYYYVGYFLYGTLFAGGFFGTMSGIIMPFKKIKSLAGIIPQMQRTWIILSVAAFTVFVILATIPMVTTSFTLEGY
ncbi:MAG: hypothetical protein C0402_07455 [Thermodesulfovibrio sp.]|nr:hypothetical protein [Thermodesulfovibrio sp.]